MDITDDSILNRRIEVLQDCKEDQDQVRDLSNDIMFRTCNARQKCTDNSYVTCVTESRKPTTLGIVEDVRIANILSYEF
ncbi:hypothetical protein K0M31_004605 [Melipona bicolor]|uniref:Uncharacterized protein n=1 Tax=Melipona bicolor TaxID=60889 RepID=A0AA40FXW5_9HYME|nr:hypothetical protein K0M31_004605 [Melipona bicolor]